VQAYPNPHDSIMQEVDVQLRHRPQPPPLLSQHSMTLSRNLAASSSGCDAQTAMRVRRWIESRSSTNVGDCRPVLNAEIQVSIFEIKLCLGLKKV
jgi:hypothetical protein